MSSTSDCTPLQQLRTDLSGDCCTWTGVTCDKRIGRVTAVRWSNTRLTGTIPSGLAGLTNLTELDLSNNQLTGGVPPELGNLKNLRQLELDRNKLSGPIPDELGGLDSVSTLNLGNNDLGGQIPETLSTLPKLSYLYLYHNNLTGPLTKLPNPSNGCNMLSSFNENNRFGCVPQGATGKCAADLIQNKLPECDGSGSPGASGSATSPTKSRGTTGSRATQPGGAETKDGGSESSSFPTLAIAGIALVGVLVLVAALVAYRRHRQRAASAAGPGKHSLNPAPLVSAAVPSQPTASNSPQPQQQQQQQQQQHSVPTTPQYPPLAPVFPPPASPSVSSSAHPSLGANQEIKSTGPLPIGSPHTTIVDKPVHDPDQDAILYLPTVAPVVRPNAMRDDMQGDSELILPPSAPNRVTR